MHEMSIAEALIRVCREDLGALGGTRIESARVAVGELSSVEPALLTFAWEALVAGTPDEGATLEIELVRVTQVCTDCGPVADRQPGTWLRLCPSCGGPLRLSGGDELDLLELSFLCDPPDPHSPHPPEPR